MGMRDEIFEQPATLGALLGEGPARAGEIAAAAASSSEHPVIASRLRTIASKGVTAPAS